LRGLKLPLQVGPQLHSEEEENLLIRDSMSQIIEFVVGQNLVEDTVKKNLLEKFSELPRKKLINFFKTHFEK
jgi:hypothetical protein